MDRDLRKCCSLHNPGVRMYIAYHSMRIIAKNSVNINPVEVSGVVLYSTERLDAIICPNSTEGAYQINMVSQDAFYYGNDIISTDPSTGAVACSDPEDTNCWQAVLSVTQSDFSDNVTDGTVVPDTPVIATAPLSNLPFYDPTDLSGPRLTMIADGEFFIFLVLLLISKLIFFVPVWRNREPLLSVFLAPLFIYWLFL